MNESMCDEPERTSEIVQEQNHLNASIQELDGQLSRLQGKLIPVTREPSPTAAKENQPTTQPLNNLVEVASRIRDSRFCIDQLTSAVRTACERIEV
jgi:hypothetical protein